MYELAYCFSIVERSLLISMGIAIAVKTGGQAACPSIVDRLVFIPAVCFLTAGEHYIKFMSIKYCPNLLIK